MQNFHFFHTRFAFKKTISLLLFLAVSNILLAQYEENDSLKIDTTYTSVSKEAPPEFDRLDPADTMFYKTHFLADSVVDRLKADEAFWYANQVIEPEKKKEEKTAYSPEEPFYLKQWFRTLIWILIIGGFVAVLIWFLVSSDVRLFRKKPSVIYSISDQVLPDDIFAIDYEKELEKTLASKNLRLSVRLMYLHVLRLLAERELIDYKIERTNSDYLAQLFSTPYYKEFFQITRHFEYVWYGKFDVSQTAFEAIREEYQTLKNRLQS